MKEVMKQEPCKWHFHLSQANSSRKILRQEFRLISFKSLSLQLKTHISLRYDRQNCQIKHPCMQCKTLKHKKNKTLEKLLSPIFQKSLSHQTLCSFLTHLSMKNSKIIAQHVEYDTNPKHVARSTLSIPLCRGRNRQHQQLAFSKQARASDSRGPTFTVLAL